VKRAKLAPSLQGTAPRWQGRKTHQTQSGLAAREQYTL